MKIKIYQISYEKDRRGLLFMRYDFAVRHGGIDPNEYTPVFDGEVEARDLEEAYCIFNDYATMPEDYTGRCASVSAIFVTEEGAFFCDSYGFVPLTDVDIQEDT